MSPLVRTIATHKRSAIKLKFYEMRYRHIQPNVVGHFKYINVGRENLKLKKNDAKTLI